MPTRKQHELQFLLNAQVGGGFSKAFQSAQRELAGITKEMQSLSRAQSDITAYQKQQAAIEKTETKLQSLRAQQELLRQEIAEAGAAGGSTAGLEREQLKLQERISNTNGTLEQQQRRLKQTGEALSAAGISTENLEQASAGLARQMDALGARQEEAANSAGTFGERSSQAIELVGQTIAAAGIAAALHEIAGAYSECVTVAAGFESSMSNVEALSGAGPRELAALNQEAKMLGATTQYTAKQSADAMGFMAMAGWDAEEMLAGMDGVMGAAAASGEDLALVSDIITDNLSAFGLAAADTAHFSDVLAQAASKSNTSIAIMGETFKGSASVAGALGYSIEDVAVAVGLMANSGVKGSIANTALKNTFNGLLEGVTLTGAAFGEYEYSAVRADGTMKALGSTIQELRGYFEQMTEAERVSNAQAIAGQEGYNGLLAILTATDESYNSLTESINSCDGAARRMAKIKLDNLNGDIALANSAWEGLQISIGEQFIPVMRTAYSVQADMLGALGEFVDWNPALVQGVGAFTGAIGLATAGVTAFVTVSKAAKALDLAALFTGPAGMALAAGAGISALIGGVVALTAAYQEQVPPVRELAAASREMHEVIEAGSAAYDASLSETLATANAADFYIGKLEAMGSAESLNAAQKQEYHNILALLCETVPELTDSIDLEKNTIEGGTEALRANTEAWKANAQAKAYQDYMGAMYQEEADLTIELEKNKVGLTKATLAQEAAEKKRADTLKRMEAANAKGHETGDFSEYYRLEASLDGINEEIVIAERSAANYSNAISEGETALAEFRTEAEAAEQAYQSLSGAAEAQSAANGEGAARSLEMQAALDGISGSLATLAEGYEEAYSAALESISGQYSLWDEAAKVEAVSAGSLNAALESQISYWQQYDANIDALTARASEIEGLSEMIASFADGTPESVNAIAGMAKANEDELKKMVANWQTLQTEQKTASDSLAQLVEDFPGKLDELQGELESAVEGMNLSTEARAAAEATIQGFIDSAANKMDAVRDAYARLGNAAASALANASTGGSTVPGAFQGAVDNVGKSFSALRGFASGTPDAPPGWAWVGENGPELMYLHGGETILPAGVSGSVAGMSPGAGLETKAGGSGAVYLSVAPVYNISGASSLEETRTALQTHDNNLRGLILEILEESGADTARRAYT